MLENPFSDKEYSDQTDTNLVEEALSGSGKSLGLLISRHQPFVYNIVWKMVLNPQNAEDITQDILIKIITKLSQFNNKSQFRTWVYRIVVNHILNVKKQFRENQFTDFEKAALMLNQLPDNSDGVEDDKDIIEDVKMSCTSGMLLCLNREQRIVFILGAIFNVPSKLGADILDVTPENFRQKLSRARKDLHNFMNNNCGLVNKANPCRCPKKTKAFIDQGWTDPDDLQFNTRVIKNIYASVPEKNEKLLNVFEEKYQEIFFTHSLQHPMRGDEISERILNDKNIISIFNLE